MNQMELTTALMGVLFALFLAALIGTPALIRLYLDLRAPRRFGAVKKNSGLQAAYPTPVPFNYPLMFSEPTLKEINRAPITEPLAGQESVPELLEAYPTPVPFNYPVMKIKSGKTFPPQGR